MNMGFSERWNTVAEQFAQHEAIRNSARQVTYKALGAQANAYACQLANLAICNGCIAVLIPDPIDHIAALLGILLSGNYYYSISLERTSMISQVLKSTGAEALITSAHSIVADQLDDSVLLIQSPISSLKPPPPPGQLTYRSIGSFLLIHDLWYYG
ncbi:AMP-binding protein [Spirosoma foliorum]|uniref:AMP-binding protein n=1 Tax=Spirosoma foliorum TaxID=2710596 RepID=A0A7G5H1M5_9BACT|nr:AMP-binding protein [Spirosoma foliorum]QMW05017.1 AMP-binding protein [Spirosoma foliorum]